MERAPQRARRAEGAGWGLWDQAGVARGGGVQEAEGVTETLPSLVVFWGGVEMRARPCIKGTRWERRDRFPAVRDAERGSPGAGARVPGVGTALGSRRAVIQNRVRSVRPLEPCGKVSLVWWEENAAVPTAAAAAAGASRAQGEMRAG